MSLTDYVIQKASQAKAAARQMATISTAVKNKALLAMADALEAREAELLEANKKDVAAASGLSNAAIDRLTLNQKRIKEMAAGLREVAALPDPVGEVTKVWQRPNGMKVSRVRVPIGVIGIIYESRPNVTADAASLCLKSGNAVVLRGGSEAIQSNAAIVKVLMAAGEKVGIPAGAITFIDNPDRQVSTLLLKQDKLIDLIIPRGGEGLMQFIMKESTIPVIKHDKGVCHTYVDEKADLTMAEAICFNAKVQRPGTCNAMETLLVHQAIAPAFLPPLITRYQEASVEVRGCPKTVALVPGVKPAADSDWGTEFLDLILAVRVVDNMDQAMEHIARHGSQHSEAIVTQDQGRAARFLNEVDAAAVFHNASTRLHDGYQFGLGAEIGISTTRIHARGAMGLEELTSTKFIVLGTGQLRE
ncbi:MAG: glutamate-5-semialdehyde dehydrogenase [Nitrospiraceae bacterium]|nr:MAG: glutamate-5-semialdehyde dehydrogenase [Nitrospiraceae bacterium]